MKSTLWIGAGLVEGWDVDVLKPHVQNPYELIELAIKLDPVSGTKIPCNSRSIVLSPGTGFTGRAN